MRPDGITEPANAPPEAGEVLRTLLGGTHTTVVWARPNTCGRMYAAFQPAGRPPGVIWGERAGADAWTDADRQYLVLSAALIERSPLLAAKAGPMIDPERSTIMAIRRGDVALGDALALIDEAEVRLQACRPSRDEPGRDRIEQWLVATHLAHRRERAARVRP